MVQCVRAEDKIEIGGAERHLDCGSTYVMDAGLQRYLIQSQLVCTDIHHKSMWSVQQPQNRRQTSPHIKCLGVRTPWIEIGRSPQLVPSAVFPPEYVDQFVDLRNRDVREVGNEKVGSFDALLRTSPAESLPQEILEVPTLIWNQRGLKVVGSIGLTAGGTSGLRFNDRTSS